MAQTYSVVPLVGWFSKLPFTSMFAFLSRFSPEVNVIGVANTLRAMTDKGRKIRLPKDLVFIVNLQ